MSRFSAAAALVKGAVLNQFGEQMELFAADRVTKLRNFVGVFQERTKEPNDLEGVSVDLKLLKMDRDLQPIIRSGLFVKYAGKFYRLDQPADLSKFSRAGINNDHFINWYVI
ncbi:hypothetical protein [Alishewanella sp. SMS8]|uniref:hypothetical protein n=1 Tax=Alishewanella sp. SMS8 TaxID=2994676 RepID=UPI0027408A80|nr:hypothetical protein [Alishewanella sp. SMS8]MDP5205796.1 hypothetical protein [Alishewanella sp. SMS9]MDP5459886.1 hypothetical protein [Alishewanella sp. SMS8]